LEDAPLDEIREVGTPGDVFDGVNIDY